MLFTSFLRTVTRACKGVWCNSILRTDLRIQPPPEGTRRDETRPDQTRRRQRASPQCIPVPVVAKLNFTALGLALADGHLHAAQLSRRVTLPDRAKGEVRESESERVLERTCGTRTSRGEPATFSPAAILFLFGFCCCHLARDGNAAALTRAL